MRGPSAKAQTVDVDVAAVRAHAVIHVQLVGFADAIGDHARQQPRRDAQEQSHRERDRQPRGGVRRGQQAPDQNRRTEHQRDRSQHEQRIQRKAQQHG